MLSRSLEQTLHRSLSYSSERKHEYSTLEALLLGLLDDQDASRVLVACGVDRERLRNDLLSFLDEDLTGLVSDVATEPKPTAGFQRVVQRAAIHVQSSGGNEVTGANVLQALFSERESHAFYFLNIQNMTRLDAVNFISHGIVKKLSPDAITSTSPLTQPPKLPKQKIGPHVEINDDGIISFPPATAVDASGDYYPRLLVLHPELRELTRELECDLRKGNIPHGFLLERVANYRKLLDRDLQEVDFHRLYLAGVRLEVAYAKTKQAIEENDKPPLGLDCSEYIESLLRLHGPFILASRAGAEAIVEEERYRRSPVQERRYRAEASMIVTALEGRPDIIDVEVVDELQGAINDFGKMPHPERSSIVGRATLQNVLIGIFGGAVGSVVLAHGNVVILGAGTAIGTLAFSETIKKLKWFKALTTSAAANVDEIVEQSSREAALTFRDLLSKHHDFVMRNQSALKDLADNEHESTFISATLAWLMKSLREVESR